MSTNDLTIGSSPHLEHNQVENDFHGLLGRLQANFEAQVGHQPLFTTDATDLWTIFLSAVPEKVRQHFTCGACRRFIEHFGHLVALDDSGRPHSPFWLESVASSSHSALLRPLRETVESAHVNGVFLSSQSIWGTPETGAWRHLSVRVPEARVFPRGLLTAGQRMAELQEHHRCLNVALGEFQAEHLAQAQTVLQADALTRSEKFIGLVEWLIARQGERKLPWGRHLIWKAVASAPAGFCTPRSSMVGSLLEDLEAGLPFETVKAKFDSKMHPLRYQRPQADPSEGNVKQAEAAFARLGLAPALERRFATLAEVPLTWRPPAQVHNTATGLFSHLRTKQMAKALRLNLPNKTLTWVKFRDTVLPTAEKLELRVPDSSSAFSALVTAVHPDAPPLLQWDRPEQRNPVSWYFYHGQRAASSWGLTPGWVKVLGVTMKPSTWFGDRFAHHGQGVFFILKGARDTQNGSLGLFPECLRSELHGVRATIEAFSRSRKLEARDGEPLASGIMFTPSGSDDSTWNLMLQVTNKGGVATYTLDRWD